MIDPKSNRAKELVLAARDGRDGGSDPAIDARIAELEKELMELRMKTGTLKSVFMALATSKELTEARKRNGFDQRHVAELLDVTQPLVSAFEARGEYFPLQGLYLYALLIERTWQGKAAHTALIEDVKSWS